MTSAQATVATKEREHKTKQKATEKLLPLSDFGSHTHLTSVPAITTLTFPPVRLAYLWNVFGDPPEHHWWRCLRTCCSWQAAHFKLGSSQHELPLLHIVVPLLPFLASLSKISVLISTLVFRPFIYNTSTSQPQSAQCYTNTLISRSKRF